MCLPINLFGGILFQLIVFIFVLGTGVSCCGNNFAGSRISGDLGRDDVDIPAAFVLFFCVGRVGAGGGTGGPLVVAIMGGGGGGAAGILLGGGGSFDCDGAIPSTTNDASDCLRFGLEMSPRQCGQVNFCMLGVRNKRVESSRFSSSVARCTNVSAVSQIISLMASLGSIRSKCCKILRNGISCGVSATYSTQIINGESVGDEEKEREWEATYLSQNGIKYIEMGT